MAATLVVVLYQQLNKQPGGPPTMVDGIVDDISAWLPDDVAGDGQAVDDRKKPWWPWVLLGIAGGFAVLVVVVGRMSYNGGDVFADRFSTRDVKQGIVNEDLESLLDDVDYLTAVVSHTPGYFTDVDTGSDNAERAADVLTEYRRLLEDISDAAGTHQIDKGLQALRNELDSIEVRVGDIRKHGADAWVEWLTERYRDDDPVFPRPLRVTDHIRHAIDD